MFKNIKWRVLFLDTWKLHENQISLSIRVCWNTVTVICFCTVYGHFHVTVAELSHCSKNHIVSKVWNIYFLALYQQWGYPQWLMMLLKDFLKVPESEVEQCSWGILSLGEGGEGKVPNERRREDCPGFPHNTREIILSACEEYIISLSRWNSCTWITEK